MAKSDTIESGRAFDDLALRRIGWISAWTVFGFLALCAVLFFYDAGAPAGETRDSGRFYMYTAEELSDINPGFQDWLRFSEPRKFVCPSGEDSCREYRRHLILEERNAPVAAFGLSETPPPVRTPGITMLAPARLGAVPGGGRREYSGAGEAGKYAASFWDDGSGESGWRPERSLEAMAVKLGVTGSVVEFRRSGSLRRAVIVRAGSDDKGWLEHLTAAMNVLADTMDIPETGCRRLVVYWPEAAGTAKEDGK